MGGDNSFTQFNQGNAGDEPSGDGQGKEKQPKKKVNIERYKDTGGLTLRKLNIGLWYVEHKSVLRMVLIGFLMLIAAVSWVYTIYGFAYYLSRGMAEDELLARQTVNTGIISRDAILAMSAKNLSLAPAGILKLSDNKYDFFIQARNPNNRRAAEFKYYFLVNGRETSRQSGFILPGESKYLLSLSNELDFKPGNAQFKIENLRWRKIDRHKIPDWKPYRDKRLNIEISEAIFAPAGKGGASGSVRLNNLEFTASNKTDYNYWSVDFIVLLYRGANIVGVNKYGIDEFMSGQVRQAAIVWPGAVSRVDKVEIVPEINIVKDDIYIKYKGGAGEEK